MKWNPQSVFDDMNALHWVRGPKQINIAHLVGYCVQAMPNETVNRRNDWDMITCHEFQIAIAIINHTKNWQHTLLYFCQGVKTQCTSILLFSLPCTRYKAPYSDCSNAHYIYKSPYIPIGKARARTSILFHSAIGRLNCCVDLVHNFVHWFKDWLTNSRTGPIDQF